MKGRSKGEREGLRDVCYYRAPPWSRRTARYGAISDFHPPKSRIYAPASSLFFPPGAGRGGEDLCCSSRSPSPLSGGGGGAARGWCLAGRAGNSAKTASKRTAPFSPSLPSSTPCLPSLSLSLSLSPSMLSWRITTHPRKTRALYPPSHLPSFLRPPSSPFSRTHPPDRLAFPAFPTSPSRHSTRWTNVTTSVRARSRDRAPGFIAPTVFASRPRLWG